MRDSVEFVQFMGFLFGLIMFFAVLVMIPVHLHSKYTCHKYGEVSGLETQHMGAETCMINDPQIGWVTYAERKAARTAERGLGG